MPYRWLAPLAGTLAIVMIAAGLRADPPAKKASDLEMVEKLIVQRRDYQKNLEALFQHYQRVGDLERAGWVKEELVQYHRITKHALILDLDVPPPNLNGTVNVPEANQLLMYAKQYKDKGWGTDYIDNQRRAELLLQELLSKYPQSRKISEAAYLLGDIYESKAYHQYRRSAEYYKRSFQWDPNTQFDSRLRAARLYDYQIKDRTKAVELYQEIKSHETDIKRVQEATKRLDELKAAAR